MEKIGENGVKWGKWGKVEKLDYMKNEIKGKNWE